jgi:hypothetical protein
VPCSNIFVFLGINATRSNQSGWGDSPYAEGLARAIRAVPGCDAAVLFRGEQPPPTDQPAVLLRILGPHLEEPVAGLANLLWMISPPNAAPLPMLARYQAVFCGSRPLAAHLTQNGVPTKYLPQATDTQHFHPLRRKADQPDIPLLFVGGYAARASRRLVLDAVDQGFEPQIWGPGWKGVIPDRLWQGERLEHDELAQVYARARIILNSHMENMARMGFMSNRSYDALASGAWVVSDMVTGFDPMELPDVSLVSDAAALSARLNGLLAAPALTLPERMVLHERMATAHGFAARAAVILAAARQALESGDYAKPAFAPKGPGGQTGTVQPPHLRDPAESGPASTVAMREAAGQILEIATFLEGGTSMAALPLPATKEGVIHPLMADLREMQQIACSTNPQAMAVRIEALTAGARRIAELPEGASLPLGPRIPFGQEDLLLVRILHNEPLWAYGPEGFRREDGKTSLRLWPRKSPPPAIKALGVFLHLYYDDLAPAFAMRLRHIQTAFSLYISTDTEAKAARIRDVLPDAEIRVLANRGRDIWPKLYGFNDVYARHEIVLHLHGKKSPHWDRLDDWLKHILDCLTGSAEEVNRILSFFANIPKLGMVVPVPFRNVLGAAHWGANRDIARELAFRMALRDPLPSQKELRFPVGSMFWARTAAIEPLLKLPLRLGHFPPEAGQVDGTLAHAIERMLGVVCKVTGHHILPVSGNESRLHVKYRKSFDSNRALREALASGVFEP